MFGCSGGAQCQSHQCVCGSDKCWDPTTSSCMGAQDYAILAVAAKSSTFGPSTDDFVLLILIGFIGMSAGLSVLAVRMRAHRVRTLSEPFLAA